MKPDTFRKLAAAGLSTEQIAIVLEIMDEREKEFAAAEDARKAQVRERVQRWRDKQKDDVTLPKRNGNATKRLTRGRDSSSKDKISGEGEDNNNTPEPTAKSNLETVLDAERAAAVVEHRKKIGKPMTPHAGALLARQFAKCPDPNAAADAMVANGWQGFKPEWMDSKQPPRSGSPPHGRKNFMDVARDRFRGSNDGPESIFGSHSNVELLPARQFRS